ncbi:uncharacterized protein LOC136075828 [Hydra vulgaris]|uniref:Uncharacterized protein LOC136075828 n=1 Tax=Hydra vulgaris TaxID=6087 RepID=A0ABM4B8Z9_HYDVU
MEEDRRKLKRVYMSGADKRKLAKEKDKKNTEIISKTRRMTEFFIKQPNTTSSSEVSSKLDIGLWPENMTGLIDYWAKVGSSNLQNCNEELFIQKSKYWFDVKFTRKCNKSLFERKTANGEIIKRSWLCFSPFNDNRLISHETSKDHLNSVINLAIHLKELGRINNIIKRLVSVITFICERGLALSGKNEIVGSSKNGNYLGILELLAEYDNFLKQHIENHANRGSGHTNYLSSTICEELIEIMGNNVLNEIISCIKLSKYFSISLDSTPDEGHIDQLTLVFRYTEKDTPVERFLVFMPNQGHKAQDMYDGLINFLNKYDLNIKNCRGQSYDNASEMSGKYNGLQSKILKNNKLASWIPCATHSLNLVGKAAAECCTGAVEFFDFLEQSDATKALILGYKQFKRTLIQIADDFEQTTKTRCDANRLYNKLCILETGIYTVFWNNILERVDKTYKLLHDATLDLNTAKSAIKSLKNFVQAKRDNFDQYEKQGVEISETTDYLKHPKRQKISDDIDEHLGNELIQFKEFYKHFKDESSEFHNISQEHLMYKTLINKEVKDCFPNVEIVLRIYLVIMITSSSSERSFSNLKHIKNRLRTSMDGDRLNQLAIMSSESDILKKLDFQNVIHNFVQIKLRKVPDI